MGNLANRRCVPCHGGVPRLSGAEIEQFMSELQNWEVVGEHHLRKSYAFPNFQQSLALVNRIGAVAEGEEALERREDPGLRGRRQEHREQQGSQGGAEEGRDEEGRNKQSRNKQNRNEKAGAQESRLQVSGTQAREEGSKAWAQQEQE